MSQPAFADEIFSIVINGLTFTSRGYHISAKQLCLFKIAAWANECERRLLNLHCGQFLPRDRHYAWAQEVLL